MKLGLKHIFKIGPKALIAETNTVSQLEDVPMVKKKKIISSE